SRPGPEGAIAPAWATVISADGALRAAVPASDLRVDSSLALTTTEGDLLVLAERADPSWRAVLDGRELEVVELDWRQAFALPGGAHEGRLEVEHRPRFRTAWLALHGGVLLVTGLLALPLRRRRGVPA